HSHLCSSMRLPTSRLTGHVPVRLATGAGGMIEKFFGLKAHGTNLRTEIVAGVTTFLTMAYIMFVNPKILAAAGMDPGAVFMATCLASALTTMLMGLYANIPVA